MVCHSLFILVNISRYDKWTTGMPNSEMVNAKTGLYLLINRPNMWSFVVVVDIFKKTNLYGSVTRGWLEFESFERLSY